jgi:uncharacterized caspase-like protein
MDNVDEPLRNPAAKNPEAVAVLVGIKSYRDRDMPAVDFASDDVAAVQKVLAQTLGFSESRILPLTDSQATLTDVRSLIKQRLKAMVIPGKSEVFFYFSGHGAPDSETHDGYLLPWDYNPAYVPVDYSAYSMKELFRDLSGLQAKRVVVLIDACFSGLSDAEKNGHAATVLKDASPAYVEVNLPVTDPAEVIITATRAGQIATWDRTHHHGVLTYSWLKAMHGDQKAAEADGRITVASLTKYLDSDVPELARVARNRAQNPEVRAFDEKLILARLPVSSLHTFAVSWAKQDQSTTAIPGVGDRTGAAVPPAKSVDLGERADCTTATVEALRLSLKAHMLERVSQNLGCRPENASDDQAERTVAYMFDDANFPQYRQFLEGLWKTPFVASFPVCLSSHQAIYAANFDGLAWLIFNTAKNKIQSCARFDDDLSSALFLVGKDRIPGIVSQLKNSGLALDYDEYSLFRKTYEAYIDNAYIGLKWVSDSLAPPTLGAFREAKARAEAHIASTSPLFTQPDPLSEKDREQVAKRMAEYCPENMSYCADNIKATPRVETPKPTEPPVQQGEFLDRETGLMWTARASDNAMNWAKAGEYCSSLRQAGYRDWRLPQLEELLRLYDTSQSTQSTVSRCKGPDGEPYTFHIKKGIDPGCGDVWSAKKSTRKLSLGGYTFDYAWLFNFAKGGPTEDTTRWLGDNSVDHHRALCVRNVSN